MMCLYKFSLMCVYTHVCVCTYEWVRGTIAYVFLYGDPRSILMISYIALHLIFWAKVSHLDITDLASLAGQRAPPDPPVSVNLSIGL